MKLEAKHLSAYLPYRLNMKRNGFIGILKQIKLPDEESLNEIYEFQVSCSNWWENADDRNHYKPILRPLSDLKDDSFIDINNQYTNTPNWDYYKEDWIASGKNLSDTIIEYCVMQWLIKNHFDVFGLIEAELAIDINTLD